MVSATAVAEVGTPIKSMQYHWADSEEVGVVPEEAVATKYTFHRLVTYFAIVIAGYVTSTIRAKVLHMLVSKRNYHQFHGWYFSNLRPSGGRGRLQFLYLKTAFS